MIGLSAETIVITSTAATHKQKGNKMETTDIKTTKFDFNFYGLQVCGGANTGVTSYVRHNIDVYPTTPIFFKGMEVAGLRWQTGVSHYGNDYNCPSAALEFYPEDDFPEWADELLERTCFTGFYSELEENSPEEFEILKEEFKEFMCDLSEFARNRYSFDDENEPKLLELYSAAKEKTHYEYSHQVDELLFDRDVEQAIESLKCYLIEQTK